MFNVSFSGDSYDLRENFEIKKPVLRANDFKKETVIFATCKIIVFNKKCDLFMFKAFKVVNV